MITTERPTIDKRFKAPPLGPSPASASASAFSSLLSVLGWVGPAHGSMITMVVESSRWRLAVAALLLLMALSLPAEAAKLRLQDDPEPALAQSPGGTLLLNFFLSFCFLTLLFHHCANFDHLCSFVFVRLFVFGS